MPTLSDSNKPDLKVFISLRDSKCDDCGEELGRQAWITLEENKGALCLACADLDELVFLPTGDAALTRRARKHSVLSAVVLKFAASSQTQATAHRPCEGPWAIPVQPQLRHGGVEATAAPQA